MGRAEAGVVAGMTASMAGSPRSILLRWSCEVGIVLPGPWSGKETSPGEDSGLPRGVRNSHGVPLGVGSEHRVSSF